MPSRDMKSNPVCRAAELGYPIPDCIHAVSVALPHWAHAIGYEEKDPEVVSRMQLGYPRFVIHPLVRKLAQQLSGSPHSLPLPSQRAAERCMAFVKEKSGESCECHAGHGIYVVSTSPQGEPALRRFWQHTGQIVSSRQAEAILTQRHHAISSAETARATLQKRLAELYACGPDDVFLLPTGMAAVDEAAQTLRTLNPGRKTAQVGFPYIDSLKLQEEFGTGAEFILSGTHAVDTLRPGVDAVAGVFCEVPSNPLLKSPDVVGLSLLLREHGIPFVIDDVVATPHNVDVTPYADLVVTSLTKFFSGEGNVMGGALICCPKSPLYAALRAIVKADVEPQLWAEDAMELERQSRSFRERMQIHNRNGEQIAERLRNHPAVDTVWYPKWDSPGHYESLKRPGGGYSSLLSFTLHDGAHNAPRVYDALRLCKGPTLGTEFTLVCPYTLLAHYGELDWAESCGVSSHLIRVSVGTEDPDFIWQRFEEALRASEGIQ